MDSARPPLNPATSSATTTNQTSGSTTSARRATGDLGIGGSGAHIATPPPSGNADGAAASSYRQPASVSHALAGSPTGFAELFGHLTDPPLAVQAHVIATMESAFGRSFSKVVLRTDESAAARAGALCAQAYTDGHEIGFARGAFAPDTAEGRLTLAHEFAHIAQRQLADSAGSRQLISTDEADYEAEADDAAAAVTRGERPEVKPATFQIAADRGKSKTKKKSPPSSAEQSSSSAPGRGSCHITWTGQTFELVFNAADIEAAANPAAYMFKAYLNRAFVGLSGSGFEATVQEFSGVCVQNSDDKCLSIPEVKERAKASGNGGYHTFIRVQLHRQVTAWLAKNYPETRPVNIALGAQPVVDTPVNTGSGQGERKDSKPSQSPAGKDLNTKNADSSHVTDFEPADYGEDRGGLPRFEPKGHLELRPKLLRQVEGAKVALEVVFDEAGGPYNRLMNILPNRAHFDWSVFNIGPDGKRELVDRGPWIETGAREYDVRLTKCETCVIEVLVTSESFRAGSSLSLQTAPIEVITEGERSTEVFDQAFVGDGEGKQFTRAPGGQLQVKPGQKPTDPKAAIDAYDREIGAINELVKQGKLDKEQGERARELRQRAKAELQKIDQGRQGQETYLVSGSFVSREDGQHTPLSLYMHRTQRALEEGGYLYEVLLLDTTLDPLNPVHHPGKLGTSILGSISDAVDTILSSKNPVTAERAALNNMADHWHRHNDYPSGTVQLAVQLKESPGQVWEHRIDTGNWRKPLKKGLAYTSMGLGILALAATPFTGGASTAVGVLMISSAVTGLAAMALDIEDRIAKEGTLKADTRLLLDIVGLAGTLLGLGALSQTLKGARLVAQTRYLIALGTSDLVQGVLLTSELRQQLLDLEADYAVRLSKATTEEEKAAIRRERDAQMNQIFGAAAVNGGLLLVSMAGTAKQLKQIRAIGKMVLRPEVERLTKSTDLSDLEKVVQAHHDGSSPLNQHELDVVEQRLKSLRKKPGSGTSSKGSAAGGEHGTEAWRNATSPEELADLIGSDYKSHPLRQEYESKIKALATEGERIIIEAGDDLGRLEKGAQKMAETRLTISAEYKDMTPEPLLDFIFEINLTRYDTKWGPSFDWLMNKYHGDFKEIIRKAATPNKDVNILLEGFRSWCLKNGQQYIRLKSE